jgi:hypothetical protein
MEWTDLFGAHHLGSIELKVGFPVMILLPHGGEQTGDAMALPA